MTDFHLPSNLHGKSLAEASRELLQDISLRHTELERRNEELLFAKAELESAQKNLENKQAFLQTILDHAPIGIWMLGTDDKIKFINQTFCGAVGIPEKMFKEVQHYSELLPEAASQNCMRSDRECLSQNDFHFSTEWLPFVDGKDHLLEITKAKIHDNSGQVIGLIGLAADISERHLLTEQLKASHVQLRELADHVEIWREEERKHIAREVHDELGQILTALRMDVAWLEMGYGDDPRLKAKAEGMAELLKKAGQSVKTIVSNLRPIALDAGIKIALEWLCTETSTRTGIKYVLHGGDEPIQLDETATVALFRIAQELLTNTARHSGATVVTITLTACAEDVHLIVQDNGVGFDVNEKPAKKSFGLIGIRERVLALGGEVVFVSSPGQGTEVNISIPTSNKAK